MKIIVDDRFYFCFILNNWLPIIIFPLRGVPVVFEATEKLTVPLPVPMPPCVIVIQLVFGVALHAHCAPVVTEMVPVPPAVVKDWAAGVNSNTQPEDVVPFWVTVNVWPAT